MVLCPFPWMIAGGGWVWSNYSKWPLKTRILVTTCFGSASVVFVALYLMWLKRVAARLKKSLMGGGKGADEKSLLGGGKCPIPNPLGVITWLVRKTLTNGHTTTTNGVGPPKPGLGGLLPALTGAEFQQRYDLSARTGFVPESLGRSAVKLGPSYACWEEAAASLPTLARLGMIRAVVDTWPMLDLDVCALSTSELRRAYVVLCLTAQAYVFCDQEEVMSSIPKQLAIPLHQAATFLGIPAVITHAAVDLWNQELVTPAPPGSKEAPKTLLELGRMPKPEDFKCVTTLTGTVDEEWFYCCSTCVQAIAGPLLPQCYRVLAQGIPSQDQRMVLNFLAEANIRLPLMAKALKRLSEKCTPDVFYDDMRPFLGGHGPGTQNPDGLVFEGVGDPAVAKHFGGASAAQSTAIPVLDATLGVSHTEGEAGFIKSMIAYMPRPHRQFLEDIRAQASAPGALTVRAFLAAKQKEAEDRGKPMSPEVLAMCSSFNDLLDRIADFRRVHWQLVGTHILAKIGKKGKAGLEDAGAASAAEPEEMGTGGSPLNTFLKNTLKATMALKLPIKKNPNAANGVANGVH